MFQIRYFLTGTRYDLKIPRKCGKWVYTKIQNVFGANFHVCRSHKGKTGREPPPPIMNRVRDDTTHNYHKKVTQQ